MSRAFQSIRAVFQDGTPAVPAFDLLVAHARAAAFEPRDSSHGKVRSVSFHDPRSGITPFSAIANKEHIKFYLLGPLLDRSPGLFEAASRRFGPVDDNSNGEYRRQLRTPEDVEAMLDFLRGRKAWPDGRHDRRFVAATFEPVTGDHILLAAQDIAAGSEALGFGPSTKFDLLFRGRRLPPKQVFGLAASRALGFPVRGGNFTAGHGAACFRILRDNGYPIVPKNAEIDDDPAIVDDEDRAWAEGGGKLVTHLRRERATGLAAAKRAHFRSVHGRLYCERCEMDPVAEYGLVGESCIEVHHRATAVADMDDGHETRLEDLLCLCANCHRVTHRELRRDPGGR